MDAFFSGDLIDEFIDEFLEHENKSRVDQLIYESELAGGDIEEQ